MYASASSAQGLFDMHSEACQAAPCAIAWHAHTQRAQYPLIVEHTLKHISGPHQDLGYTP